jgi:hypothetical protein
MMPSASSRPSQTRSSPTTGAACGPTAFAARIVDRASAVTASSRRALRSSSRTSEPADPPDPGAADVTIGIDRTNNNTPAIAETMRRI